MKKFILGLLTVLGSFQAHAESEKIHVTVTVPTCYQNSTGATANALKLAQMDADAQCAQANWYNPWLTDLKVHIEKRQNGDCGGVTVDAEYSCTNP